MSARTRVTIVLLTAVLGVSAAPDHTLSAFDPPDVRRPADLLKALTDALNSRHPQLLASLYWGYFPHTLCNDFEIVLANAMLHEPSTIIPPLRLEELPESTAALVGEALIRPAPESEDRIFVGFILQWSYRPSAPPERRDLVLGVSWNVKRYDWGWRVITQRTTPCWR